MARTGSALITTDVDVALGCLRRGGLVAIPTETVYGLAADAEDTVAVSRIFEVKGRPAGHPLIIHLASADELSGWAAEVPPVAELLANSCWPGPLTLLLHRGRRVLDVVTGGRPTVGLRVPAHPATADLLRRSGGGLAAPSANRFGRVSPTTAADVLADIGSLLDPTRDAILDGGPSPVGVESTIVDCTTDPPQLLRPGGISVEDLERLLHTDLAPASGPSRAAGMLATHYAPVASVLLVDDRDAAERAVAGVEGDGGRALLIDHGDDLVTYARMLYRQLRDADAEGVSHVVAVVPPARSLGHAIRDRLTKAAHR